jgi:hypothetical protein
MVNIDVREKNGEIKSLKSELRKKNLQQERRQELHERLTLLESFVTESKAKEKAAKENFKDCQVLVSDCKKNN